MSNIDLDVSDRALLNALQADCRRSIADLAKAAGISIPTCQRRLQKLRSSGVIEREVAIVNPVLSPKPVTVLIDVVLERHGVDVHRAFEASMAAVAEVGQCYNVTGEVDFVVVMNVADVEEYHRLAMKHFAGNKDVRTFRSVFVINRAKFNPAIVF